VASSLDATKLPRHRLELGSVPGRTGTLLVQGGEFLAGPPPVLAGGVSSNPLLRR
jgi:hypothetical protein